MVISEVVKALSEDDFALARGIPSVSPPDAATAIQVKDYVQYYGESLVPLPPDAWETSVSQWVGSHT